MKKRVKGPQTVTDLLSIDPLDAPLGATIHGVDLRQDMDETATRLILAALFEHQVIVIPGQRLEAGDFARFARHFGRPEPHILSHLRHPDYPEILPLSNIFKDGEPTGVYDGAAYWHTDMSYEAEPSLATLVYSIQAPESGGETRFTNMARAYDALPPETKARIEGLTVLHHYGNRADPKEDSRTSASKLDEYQKKQVKNVFHPLVRPHPVTGRKALYAVAGSSFGIVGMDDGEAHGLLDDLATHATKPDFVHAHRYAVGDLVVWDNAQTLHSATLIPPATGPRDTRQLYRISVKGLPPLSAN